MEGSLDVTLLLVLLGLLLIQYGKAVYHADEIFDWKIHAKAKKGSVEISTTHASINHCHPSEHHYQFIWDDAVVYDQHSSIVQVYPVHHHSLSNNNNNSNIFIDSFTTHPKRIFQVMLDQVAHVRPHCYNDTILSDLLDSSSNTTRLTQYYDCMFDRYDTHPLRMAVLHNALTNNYGAILNPSDCKLFRNGGCYFMHHGKIYKFLGKVHEHELVISLGSGASGTWHFPMESVVALAYLPDDLLRQAYFLVPSASQYITQWLSTLGVPHNHIIQEPTVLAKTLLVPEMGRCSIQRCDPYLEQISWFVKRFTSLAYHSSDNGRSGRSIDTSVATTPTTNTTHRQPVILVIQRRNKRKVENFNAILELTRQFAVKNHMNVDIHDDENLPSLLEQIKQFTRADIIVAPHGAALLFSVFARPRACVIEFLNPGDPYCYSRLAYIRNMSYISHSFQDGNKMKEDLVSTSLLQCQVAIS